MNAPFRYAKSLKNDNKTTNILHSTGIAKWKILQVESRNCLCLDTLWIGMLKFNLKDIYLYSGNPWKQPMARSPTLKGLRQAEPRHAFCKAAWSWPDQTPSAVTGKNQNTSHNLALRTSPRHCLLNSPSLGGNLKSTPTTLEQNPDTDR